MRGFERLAWMAVFALIVGLQITAIRRQSLIDDEPHHFLAGYQALMHGSNTLNLEHPPLVKLIAAGPLVLSRMSWREPLKASQALKAYPTLFDDPHRAHFARLWGRSLLLVLVALPFLLTVALLGREVGGRRVGLVLAALVGLSLSTLPNLSLAQTDTAVALGFSLGLLGALRWTSRRRSRDLFLVAIGLGVACASKFSGVLLVPIVVAVVLRPDGLSRERLEKQADDRGMSRRLRDIAVVLVLAGGVVMAIYALANRRYDPEAGREAIRLYAENHASMVTADRLLTWEPRLLALERVSPGAAQFATGLLAISAQNAEAPYPSYAFGDLTSDGRWWYFPAVFLVKTPLLILVALVAAAHTGRLRLPWVLAACALLYLAVAMGSNYNIGLRHLLPITAVLYLPAARWLAASGRRLAAGIAMLALEAICVAPLWVAATNTWWLGDANPSRLSLSAGDKEMHQSFVVLAEEARARGLARLTVLYPLLGEAELRAYLPSARTLEPSGEASPSLEPGWVAVSVILDQYVPALLSPSSRRLHDRPGLEALARDWAPLWREVKRHGDCGTIAGTFRLYRVGGPCEGP